MSIHNDSMVIQWKTFKMLSRPLTNNVELLFFTFFSGTSRAEDHLRTNKKNDSNCQLTCNFLETASDDWGCFLQNMHIFPECSTLTASMLNNAMTTETKYPFLRNITSPTLNIAFGPLYLSSNARPKLND